MDLEVAHHAWRGNPRHPGQGSFRSHYRALSQWTSYLSAFQQHSGCFWNKRLPRPEYFQILPCRDQSCSFQKARVRLLRRCTPKKTNYGISLLLEQSSKAHSNIQHHLQGESSALPSSLPQVGSLGQPALTDVPPPPPRPMYFPVWGHFKMYCLCAFYVGNCLQEAP